MAHNAGAADTPLSRCYKRKIAEVMQSWRRGAVTAANGGLRTAADYLTYQMKAIEHGTTIARSVPGAKTTTERERLPQGGQAATQGDQGRYLPLIASM